MSKDISAKRIQNVPSSKLKLVKRRSGIYNYFALDLIKRKPGDVSPGYYLLNFVLQ
jgi:hypothetical protein